MLLLQLLCSRLRVSVLEAFDPLLLNDSSEANDQGNFNNYSMNTIQYSHVRIHSLTHTHTHENTQRTKAIPKNDKASYVRHKQNG